MWGILFKALAKSFITTGKSIAKLAKNSAKVTKRITKIAKNKKLTPLKKLSKVNSKYGPIAQAQKFVKRKFKQQSKKVQRVKRALSPNQKLKDRIIKKATLVENIVETTNEIGLQRTNYTISLDKVTDKVLDDMQGSKPLRGYTKSELQEIEKALNEELLEKGIEFEEDIDRYQQDEAYRDTIHQDLAYDTFMDNWKTSFFKSDVEQTGVEDEEKEAVWDSIMADKTPEWFEAVKVLGWKDSEWNKLVKEYGIDFAKEMVLTK